MRPSPDGPRRNRVTPSGDLIAVPDRGTLWGNRGCLHDAEGGDIVRYSRGKAWIACVLEFKGRRRTLMKPGRFTELFFLDEATALSAGHRPCGECRRGDLLAFKAAWRRAYPEAATAAPAIDERLHADRLRAPGVRRTYRARIDSLPGGTFVEVDGRYWLVSGSRLLAWTPGGYREDRPRRAQAGTATVITPRAIVAVLRAGYLPMIHPTADRALGR